MKVSRSKRVTVLALALVGVVAVTAAGLAIAASSVVTDTNTVRLRVVQSEFTDGFDSGWHTHPGPVIVQVQAGKFKLYQGSCSPRILRAGDTYIEIPLVPIRAVAKGEIKWTTSQVLPNLVGDPAQTSVADPCA
jgi:quercetin dioxygenase-like cupin family protein